VAPVIESFTTKAAAASGAPTTCCQCFTTTGAFLGAGQDDFTVSTCRTFCDNVNPGIADHGHFVFFSANSQQVFSSSAVPPTGCSFAGTYLGANQSCPGILPAGVTCTAGTFPT
jgi:hypothetical protein